ncbi:MAG: hypothetical protein GVY30_07530 [Chloroflexi bacterium]|nr:hypothetical protein [Chloroflexota bacterium]
MPVKPPSWWSRAAGWAAPSFSRAWRRPSLPSAEEINATGAGDIFAAAFFVALTREMLSQEAVAFAACIAADSVRREGLTSAPSPSVIAACSEIR